MNGGVSHKRGNVVYFLSDDKIIFIKFGIRYIVTPKNIRSEFQREQFKLVSFLIESGELGSISDVFSELEGCYQVMASSSLAGYV
jgi:hypothetical protein